MNYNQFEAIKRIHDYYWNMYTDNIEKTSKLPFYNPCPYRPSKKFKEKLKDGVKDIQFTTIKALQDKK